MRAHTVTTYTLSPYTLFPLYLIPLCLIPLALLEHFPKRSYILFIKTPKPYLAGLVVFLVGMVLTQYAAYQRYLISKESERQDIIQETNTVQDQLKTALSYSLSAAKTLAFIVEEYGVPEDFNRVAAEILESNKFIDALELTSRGTITHVYPLEGNEQAIGYDILANPVNAAGAYKAIEKKELFFSVPLN
jgi:sensor domain CHASE-containing protein